MSMFDRLPEDTQTLHAELLALLVAIEGERRFAYLDGLVVQKNLGGRDYVYFQYSDPGGRRRQFAIGPTSPAVDAIVAAYREGRAEFEADRAPIERSRACCAGPQLDHRHASTSFKVRGQQLRLDLVTPGATNADAPIHLPNLRAAAAPIRFLSLLLDDTMLVPAIGDGATLVRIPLPARFALHKLLLSQMRSAPQQTKSQKDLHQAALLLEVLGEDRPDDLAQVAHAFAASGDTVTKKVLRALAAAAKRWPEAQDGGEVVRRGLSSS